MDEFVKPARRRALYKKYHGEGGDHCGLQNLGCICYMLSVMQQFFMITPFRQGILQVSSENRKNSSVVLSAWLCMNTTPLPTFCEYSLSYSPLSSFTWISSLV